MTLNITEIINMNQDQLYNNCHVITAIPSLVFSWIVTFFVFLVIGLLLLKRNSYGKFLQIYIISMVFITATYIFLIMTPEFTKIIYDAITSIF